MNCHNNCCLHCLHQYTPDCCQLFLSPHLRRSSYRSHWSPHWGCSSFRQQKSISPHIDDLAYNNGCLHPHFHQWLSLLHMKKMTASPYHLVPHPRMLQPTGSAWIVMVLWDSHRLCTDAQWDLLAKSHRRFTCVLWNQNSIQQQQLVGIFTQPPSTMALWSLGLLVSARVAQLVWHL